MHNRDKLLRVLLVTPDYPPTQGGIQSLLHGMTSSMPACEVRVITMSTPGCLAFDRDNPQPTKRVPRVGRGDRSQNAIFNLSAAILAPRWRPDIVLSGHVTCSPAAALIAARVRAPWVTYAYGKEIGGRPGLARWSAKRGDGVIAISQFTKGMVESACGGSALSPIEVIHPGVAVPENLERVDASRPTIVTVARLRDRYKGHDVMLEAMERVVKEVPTAEWIVIGDGPLRPWLENEVQRRSLQAAVTVMGAVDDETRNSALLKSDVFAMPARYPPGEVAGEGFAMVFLEAAVRGVPGVAGDVGAPTEAVVGGQTGTLVPAQDSQAVAAALIHMLRDREGTRAMGLTARKRAETEFAWPVVAGQLRDHLASVAARGETKNG